MKKQKLFWIRENKSVGIMTFLMSLISCYYIFEFRQSLQLLWENLYTPQTGVDYSYDTDAFTEYLSTANHFYMVLIFLMMILTYLLFRNMGNQQTREWIGSLPLKRKDMYWYKLRQGVIAYTIPVIFFGAGCTVLMVNNRGWMVNQYLMTDEWKYLMNQESIAHYLIVAGMMWLWATACFMIFFFAQCICRKAVVASLLGLGMVHVTGNFGYMCLLIQMNYSARTVSAMLSSWGYRLCRCYTGIFLNKTLINSGTYFGTIFEDFEQRVNYQVHWYEPVIIAVTVLVTLVLSYHYFKKMNQPGTEGLFVSGMMRAFAFWGFSFCVGADIFYLIVQLTGIYTNGLKIYLASIPISIVLAVVLHLLFKRRGY